MSIMWDSIYNRKPSELETKVTSYEARITQLESDNATIVEDAAMVADENKRLKRIAEAAVRFVTVYRVTHPYYDALLVELRAEGYMGGGE